MASSLSTADPPRILVATMIPAKDGGIAFLMGRRQVDPERGTWFFPSDALLPGEKVEDCVQRVLKQVGMTLKDSSVNKILDHLPAQPLVKMDDTFPLEIDEDLCKSTTIFVYCLRVDELPEKERDTKTRKTSKDGASITEVSLGPFSSNHQADDDGSGADGAACVSTKQDGQPEKMDKLRYFSWDQIELMCKHEESMVPFSALRNFIRKWYHVNWEKNPWNAYVSLWMKSFLYTKQSA